MNNQLIFNFVSECKEKLFVDVDKLEVIDVHITKDVGKVLILMVTLKTEDGRKINVGVSVHKETAYNYSRSKLLKKIIEKTKCNTT